MKTILLFFSVMALTLSASMAQGILGGGGAESGAGDQPTLTASLVDEQKKAEMKAATVQVEASGVDIVDADEAGQAPKEGQGHFHYQVDQGPIIATTANKLSFHGLEPGSHTISVSLAGNDHKPIGPQETLTVTIK